jgi:hypothetical protein
VGEDGADAFADKVENDKKSDVRFDPARGLVPLRVWARDWLERRVIGESTRRNYEGFIRNHLLPSLGRKMLAGLARRDFEEFAKDVHASGAGLAVSTVNDRMVMVAAMLEAAVVDKRIPDNPARGVRISRAVSLAVDEDEIPTPGEVDLIAQHIARSTGSPSTCSRVPDSAPVRPWPFPASAGGLASSGSAGRSVPRLTMPTAARLSCPARTGWRVSTETFRLPRSSIRKLTPTCRGVHRCPWSSQVRGASG